jgi:ubiquinone/menaquinone biosynthesis C-methylase UbiE
MKKTNYGRIAQRYDHNPDRHSQPIELAIENYCSQVKGDKKVKILDLACGTGNFLAAQARYFPNHNIEWYGVDKSTEMLEVAVTKTKAVLKESNASAICHKDNFFDIVTCNFAFHHFDKKKKVLSEIFRILQPSGLFILKNVCPEFMERESWLYHYFPSTYDIDLSRFMLVSKLQLECMQRFSLTEFTVKTSHTREPLKKLLLKATNRDMSQLTLIDNIEYEKGLKRITRDSVKMKWFTGQIASLKILARK